MAAAVMLPLASRRAQPRNWIIRTRAIYILSPSSATSNLHAVVGALNCIQGDEHSRLNIDRWVLLLYATHKLQLRGVVR